jgi:hypothetical protein
VYGQALSKTLKALYASGLNDDARIEEAFPVLEKAL